MATKIAKNSRTSLILGKKAVSFSTDAPANLARRYERSMFGAILSTPAGKEGVNAFLEKRKADFSQM